MVGTASSSAQMSFSSPSSPPRSGIPLSEAQSRWRFWPMTRAKKTSVIVQITSSPRFPTGTWAYLECIAVPSRLQCPSEASARSYVRFKTSTDMRCNLRVLAKINMVAEFDLWWVETWCQAYRDWLRRSLNHCEARRYRWSIRWAQKSVHGYE